MAFNWHAFILGMARCIDIGGALNSPEVERILSQSDADAIRSDWQAVGDDLRRAMREYEHTSPSLSSE